MSIEARSRLTLAVFGAAIVSILIWAVPDAIEATLAVLGVR